jgi:ketosteroid isomerase-like protein
LRRRDMTAPWAVLILLLLGTPMAAETETRQQQLEAINRQLWLPFIEGIRTDRADLYVGVHSEHFYWVAPGNNGRIMDLREYDEDSRSVMERRKAAGERTEIEFRFLERNVDGDFAAEKAIVKFVSHRRGKPPETSYGISHYFSRKEKGVWKMWLQYRSNERADEVVFAAAAPVTDVMRFGTDAKR